MSAMGDQISQAGVVSVTLTGGGAGGGVVASLSLM
jgi:hypothetical protein